MDRQKIGLIGALLIVAIALVGGLVLTAKGIPVPAWLAGLLTVGGTGAAWFIAPPGAGKDGAK